MPDIFTPIRVSELPEVTTAADSDYLIIDDGTQTSRISSENYNATASESAKHYADEALISAQNAGRQADAASDSATAAENKAQEADASAQASEAWAVGKRNGADVPSTDEAYHNNAKYFSEQAHASATEAAGSADDAAQSAASISGLEDQIEQNTEDVTALKSAFSEFPEGSYPDMTVGGVMSVEDGAEDQVPYTFRASGGGVAVGNREIDEIVGGTVAWNQLAELPPTETHQGITITNNGDGSLTINGTATEDINSWGIYNSWVSGHVYYFANMPSGVRLYNQIYNNNSWVKNLDGRTLPAIRKYTDSAIANRMAWSHYIAAGTTLSNVTYYPMIFDLTQMFGSTIADYIYALETAHAGDGVAWFRRLFPNDYYAYDAGTLKSVEGVSAHVMRGFNQWDEQWELGAISQSTGADTSSTSTVRTIGYIPVIPGARYYFKKPTNGMGFRWYDANKNYVGSGSTSAGYTYAERNAPSNASYLRFTIGDTTTYTPGTLCLNLYDPDRNGIYEPYDGHTYLLDSSLTLRGIPKLDSANRLYYDGDTYASDGTVTRRYGIVDLGTLNWETTGTIFYTATAPLFGNGGTAKLSGGILCPIYDNKAVDTINPVDMRIWVSNTQFVPVLRISDSRYTDVNAYKTAMSGVMALVELYTPTTEQAAPYTNPQIVDNLGTEEYVTTGIVPVGHSTQYPTDIVAKVDGLPSDFSTLIAPTEIGFKATRAYSVNQFLIVDNQLYKVTASIASGATITPGTNVTACTVADILTQLLNA